ncbi:MAG: lipopolysaccharide heptosyltransferase II [Pseudomonadales bacterium]|jgi:heptosyltransferase-2
MNDRILIVGPSWVGDMVMAQTLFKSLAKTRPGVQIDVMAPPAALAVANRMQEVDRTILFDIAHGQLGISYRRQFARSLKDRDYQQAIVLPNSLKSALVPWFADIENRTGFLGEMRYFLLNDIRLLDKKRLPRMIDRFVALGDEPNTKDASLPVPSLPELSFPELGVDSKNQSECLSRLSLDMERPVLAICPGAEFGDAKRWPEAHYAGLCNYAIERGMQVWIFGSPRDEKVAAGIVSGIDDKARSHNLTGRTTLVDVVDLLALARLVVSNDSGLMHIAAAVGCETTVVYGSTSPDFTPPLTHKLNIVSDKLSCSPCFKRDCPLGHKDCLNKLLPDRLHPIIDNVLGESR